MSKHLAREQVREVEINLSLPRMQCTEEFQRLRRTVRHECGLRRDCKRPNRGPHSTLILHKMMWIMKRHSSRHAPWVSRERNLRSKIRWFTEFCNSHYLSQLATFFIDARAKRSTVKSCIWFLLVDQFNKELHEIADWDVIWKMHCWKINSREAKWGSSVLIAN